MVSWDDVALSRMQHSWVMWDTETQPPSADDEAWRSRRLEHRLFWC